MSTRVEIQVCPQIVYLVAHYRFSSAMLGVEKENRSEVLRTRRGRGGGEPRNASKSCNGSDKSGECGRSYVFMYLSVNYIYI